MLSRAALANIRSGTGLVDSRSGATFRRSLDNCGCGRRVTTRASDDNREGVDWDGAWVKFKRNVAAGIPEVDSNVATKPPRFAEKRGDWNNGQRQQAIKQQERFLLNVWSQDTFFKSGGLAVIVFFVIVILLAGPPPSDGRCTLPWC